MNDSEFEDQLRALRPVAPSPNLENQIAQDLNRDAAAHPRSGWMDRPSNSAGSGRRWWRDIGAALAGAAVALVAIYWPEQSAVPAAKPAQPIPPVVDLRADIHTYEPAESAEEMLATIPTEEWIDTSAGWVRAVRYQSRERHAWSNPQTGSRLEIEVPRDNVVFLPVSLQ